MLNSTSKLDRLHNDLHQTQYFILRLEKEGALNRIPFFRSKLKMLTESIVSLEEKGMYINKVL
jgi:hypothetical protein